MPSLTNPPHTWNVASITTNGGHTMALDPHFEAKASFDAHWETLTKTRQSLTFEGMAPNHDHIVRITQTKKGKASQAAQAKASKPARLAIPVIMGGRI